MPRLFIFGLGYSARVFARRLSARGWRVAGTSRNPEAAAALRAEGFEVSLFDRDRPLSARSSCTSFRFRIARVIIRATCS